MYFSFVSYSSFFSHYNTMFLEAFSQVLILHFIVFCLLINGHYIYLWGTIPSVRNVAQPPLRKASGERGWWAGPTSMDRFSLGKSGLHCTQTAMRLALAKTPSP